MSENFGSELDRARELAGTQHRGTPASAVAAPAASPDRGSVEVVRSQERLVPQVQRVVAGRARLVRYVETETRQITVEVRRELARLEVEDIAAGGPAPEGYRAAAAEQVFVLREEEPVVTMRTVPYAQARLVIDLDTREETVTGTVRAERVEASGDLPDAAL